MSMKERDREKFLARQAEQAAAQRAKQPARKPRRRSSGERYASREEQQARYLDCGPQMWDDRDSGPDY